MKILFVWTGITRCMGDCWRSLAALPDVELRLVFDAPRDVTLEREVLYGLNCEFNTMTDFRPDVLFALGWHSSLVRSHVQRIDWRSIPKVLCFDMPWRDSWRCFAARYVLCRYLRKFRSAYVPGKLAEKYARWMGFENVSQGLLAVDQRRFAPVAGERSLFIYVGRNDPAKGLDDLRAAYAEYRRNGGRWPLEFHFATPYADLPAVYARAGALVLPSYADAWPLVVLEAKSAGCEVIASDRCGNALELGARIVKCHDVHALAAAMREVEMSSDCLTSRDERLVQFDASNWATRTLAIAQNHE